MLCGDYDNSESVDDPSWIQPTHGLNKNKCPDRKQIMTVMDGDGLILTGCFLDGNMADCEYNHLMLQTLQEVYRDEFAVPILQTIPIPDPPQKNRDNFCGVSFIPK